jgi:hypothetical protein
MLMAWSSKLSVIERHKAWRLQYREERYLRDLSNTELFARAGDLMTISLGHSGDGKIGLSPAIEDISKMERFTHVLEEFVIRGLELRQPGILEAMQAPKPGSPKVRRALQTLAGKIWPNPILVKFGERKHLAALFLQGKGRISLAKTYDDPSLGRARAHDESQISTYVHPIDAHRLMAVEHYPHGGSRGLDVEVPYLGSVKVHLKANAGFYVYCMAQSCNVRMFDDFTTATSDVDACVIVTNPDEFKARIRQAIATKVPGWNAFDSAVVYVDPFFSRVHQLTPHFCKHFRFEYQKEYRFIWAPPDCGNPAEPAPPDHVPFDLGPLTGCAKLIWL